MKRKYTRLRYVERKKIEQLFASGKSVAEVADELGTHRDTIYKELKRCGQTRQNYKADMAQQAI